jgi:hypothetical protein
VDSGQQVCVFWDKADVPSDSNDTVNATLTITGGSFQEPVWVDTISGGVYAIPEEKTIADAGKAVFKDIPVYDAPTFIADRSLLTIVPSNH